MKIKNYKWFFGHFCSQFTQPYKNTTVSYSLGMNLLGPKTSDIQTAPTLVCCGADPLEAGLYARRVPNQNPVAPWALPEPLTQTGGLTANPP